MKSWLMIAVLVLAVASAFLLFEDSNSVNLAPRTYKPGLPDLITNITINNILNQSTNSSALFLINYTIDYQNIGNVIAPNSTVLAQNWVACPGGGSGGGGPLPIPALAPNQKISVRLYTTIGCYNATWTGYSMADYLNVVTEINENNNNGTISVSI